MAMKFAINKYHSLCCIIIFSFTIPLCSGCKDRLHDAVDNGDFEKVQKLVKSGIDVNIRNKYGSTALHFASIYGVPAGHPFISLERRAEIAEFLIRHGADVNALNETKFTPIYMAAMHGNYKVAEVLVLNGADVNIKGPMNLSPLHESIEQNYNDSENYRRVIDILIKNGADVNAQNNFKETPLHDAVDIENLRIVEMLVKNGADVNIKNDKNKSPLDYAIQSGNKEIEKLLRSYSLTNKNNM